MLAQRSMYRMCSPHADGLNHLDTFSMVPEPLVNSVSILIGRETLE